MIALAALVAGLALGRPEEPRATLDPLARVRAVLQPRGPHDARTPAELAAGLAHLGPEAVPVLYGLARGQGLEPLIGDEWRPEAWLCLPEEISRLALEALGSAPAEAVLAELEAALAGPAGVQERIVALRLLAAQGGPQALALVLTAARGLGELESSRPSVQRDLREAVRAILHRDGRAWPLLVEQLETLEPVLAPAWVEAIGASERSRGLAVLARLRAQRPELGLLTLEAMVALELARPWILAGETRAHLASTLRLGQPAERARAARLAATLHAPEVVPLLLAALADGAPAVRAEARGALFRLAGLDLGEQEEGWSAWAEGEQLWRAEDLPQLRARLRLEDAGAANAALVELLRHPLHRHELATVLAEELLELPRPVALQACVELERLGSRHAVPALLRALPEAPPALGLRISACLTGLLGWHGDPPLARLPAELEL